MDKLKEQEHRCALSGISLHPETTELDHIVPISSGGDDSANNLQFLDGRVHLMRGTIPVDEFVELCCRVADYSRRSDVVSN